MATLTCPIMGGSDAHADRRTKKIGCAVVEANWTERMESTTSRLAAVDRNRSRGQKVMSDILRCHEKAHRPDGFFPISSYWDLYLSRKRNIYLYLENENQRKGGPTQRLYMDTHFNICIDEIRSIKSDIHLNCFLDRMLCYAGDILLVFFKSRASSWWW